MWKVSFSYNPANRWKSKTRPALITQQLSDKSKSSLFQLSHWLQNNHVEEDAGWAHETGRLRHWDVLLLSAATVMLWLSFCLFVHLNKGLNKCTKTKSVHNFYQRPWFSDSSDVCRLWGKLLSVVQRRANTRQPRPAPRLGPCSRTGRTGLGGHTHRLISHQPPGNA